MFSPEEAVTYSGGNTAPTAPTHSDCYTQLRYSISSSNCAIPEPLNRKYRTATMPLTSLMSMAVMTEVIADKIVSYLGCAHPWPAVPACGFIFAFRIHLCTTSMPSRCRFVSTAEWCGNRAVMTLISLGHSCSYFIFTMAIKWGADQVHIAYVTYALFLSTFDFKNFEKGNKPKQW